MAQTSARKTFLCLAVIGAMAILPFGIGVSTIRLFTSIFMYIVLAQSWNIIGGYTGYVSFGNALFFGLGAYTTGILMLHLHVPFTLGLVASAAVAFGAALLIGIPVLRLKGHYLAVATFGVAEAMRELFNNLRTLAGGGEGLSYPLPAASIRQVSYEFYYLMLVTAILTMIMAYQIARRPAGYAMMAIRDDEDAASVMGINSTKYKVLAFCLSALFTGVVGGIFGYWVTFIEPNNVFSIQISVMMVIMVLLGGIGTLWGPVIGALILEFLSDLLISRFPEYHGAVLGFIIIIVVVSAPRGLMEIIKDRKKFSCSYFLENIRKYQA
jgi:branched-chain amino acid transport system permease protein